MKDTFNSGDERLKVNYVIIILNTGFVNGIGPAEIPLRDRLRDRPAFPYGIPTPRKSFSPGRIVPG